ncbi:hypothetical protein Ctob_000035, partial [Chrysochromulina tobinii]
MSFRATHGTRDPPHTSGMLWAVACLRRDPSSAPRAFSRSWSHISMLPIYTHVSCSQDERDAHQLCSGEDNRPQRHHPVARRRTPTATSSTRSPSPRTGPRLCLD